MADLKISQLSDGGASQATDEYVVARSGANYRIDGASVAAAATSVGTLTSLTVSGILTSTRTSGQVVKAESGTTGILYSNFTNTGGTLLYGIDNSTGTAIFSGSTAYAGFVGTSGSTPLILATNGATRLTIDTSGNLAVDTNTLYVDATNNRVGIGTASPAATLDVAGAVQSNTSLTIVKNGSGSPVRGYGVGNAAGTREWTTQLGGSNELTTYYFNGTAWSNPLTLDASGNLGLGVTPSAWGSPLTGSIQVGNLGISRNSNGSTGYITSNGYWDGANWKYINNGNAAKYVINNSGGVHFWETAASGTAGNTISFTQAMTLDASGNLGVGTGSNALTTRLEVSTGSSDIYANIRLYNRSSSNHTRWGINCNAGDNTKADVQLLSGVSLSDNTSNTISIGGGTSGSGFMPVSTIAFNTSSTPGTVSSGTERARITSGGYLLIDTTAASGDARLVVNNADNVSGDFNTVKKLGANCSNTSSYHLICSTGADDKLYIYGNGNVVNTGNSYGTLSDEKLKQDIVDAPSQWDDLKAIKFRKYRLKSEVASNPDAPMWLGVVAQELEQVSPGLIDESEDFAEVEVTDEDGNVTTERQATGTVTKSVKTSVLLLKAAVALQEAMTRIEALEVEVAALKGGA